MYLKTLIAKTLKRITEKTVIKKLFFAVKVSHVLLYPSGTTNIQEEQFVVFCSKSTTK